MRGGRGKERVRMEERGIEGREEEERNVMGEGESGRGGKRGESKMCYCITNKRTGMYMHKHDVPDISVDV